MIPNSGKKTSARFSGLMLIALIIGFCSLPTFAAGSNVLPLTVTGHNGSYNRMFVSVTVCAPNTNNCETINNVMVDTGSIGLRIQRKAMAHPEWFNAMAGPNQKPLAECYRFLSSNAWGKVARADVKLADITAKNIPVQIIDEVARQDDAAPRPESCSSTVKPTANGTLGIAAGHSNDCGGLCQLKPENARYYDCENGACSAITEPVTREYRVVQPIAALPQNNNGYILDTGDAPNNGSGSVSGKLILGIDLQDNSLKQKNRVYLGAHGNVDTEFNGVHYPRSYFDSGTQDLYFADAPSSLQQCGHAWCADGETKLNAQITGADGATVNVPFRVGNTQQLRASRKGAIPNVARVNTESTHAFVWGMPFFYGKRVYVGIVPLDENADVKPFYAF